MSAFQFTLLQTNIPIFKLVNNLFIYQPISYVPIYQSTYLPPATYLNIHLRRHLLTYLLTHLHTHPPT